MVNCINWKKGSQKLLRIDQIQKYAKCEKNPKLLAISDVAALINGPIELFKEENKIENPYFLYDMERDKRYGSYQELQRDSQASDKIIAYLGVEQLPAELPIDASMMFSSKLQSYIPHILSATHKIRSSELSFNDVWQFLPPEIQRATTTTSEGATGNDYEYLNALI